MHTSPSSQATWGTSTMFPKQNYEASNFRRPRPEQIEDSEAYQPELDRFRRSPAPSVSPTRARFAAMGHVAKDGVGEEPFNYADLHPTFGMGQNPRKNGVPKVIPRLRSRSRSSSFRNTAAMSGPQTFQGSQYTRSAIVDRSPRAPRMDSNRAPYSIGPAVDHVGVININERTLDLDAFWRKFKYWEENYAELPDSVFHYISDIGHLNQEGTPYFHESHFNNSFFFLHTMIARYAVAYRYEMRAMDLQQFNLEGFEKQYPSLTRLIDSIVDCRGGLYQFFEEADCRVHLVQAITAQNIVAYIFYVRLFGATPEEEKQFDALDGIKNKAQAKALEIKTTRTILNGAPVPRNFLPEVVKLSKHIHRMLAPLRTLSPNPLTTSAAALEESQDQLKAIILWAAKLGVDMRLQNASFTFQWATVSSPVSRKDHTIDIANEYELTNADYNSSPGNPSRPSPIVELALFPSATSVDASGAETMHCPKVISVRHGIGSSFLARPNTNVADLIVKEIHHGVRLPVEERERRNPGAQESDSDSGGGSIATRELETDTPQEHTFFEALFSLRTPSGPNAPWWKRVFRIINSWETLEEVRRDESIAFIFLRAIVLFLLLVHIWNKNGLKFMILLLWIFWFLLELTLLRGNVRNGIFTRYPGLYIWFVALLLWSTGALKWESWGTMMERRKRSWY